MTKNKEKKIVWIKPSDMKSREKILWNIILCWLHKIQSLCRKVSLAKKKEKANRFWFLNLSDLRT